MTLHGFFKNCPGGIVKYGKTFTATPSLDQWIGVGENIASNPCTQVILGAARPGASEAPMIGARLLVPPHLRPRQRREIISSIARVVRGDHALPHE